MKSTFRFCWSPADGRSTLCVGECLGSDQRTKSSSTDTPENPVETLTNVAMLRVPTRARILGPESTYVPATPSTTSKRIVPDGTRRDGRTPRSARVLHAHCVSSATADGASYVELGANKIACSVFGPRHAASGNMSASAGASAAAAAAQHVDGTSNDASALAGTLRCDFKFAPFARRDVAHAPYTRSSTEHELALQLRNALLPAILLHTFPRAVVAVHVTALEADSSQSCLVAAIIAASLALANAGVQLYDMVSAASVAIVRGNNILVDLSIDEERDLLAGTLLGVPRSSSITRKRPHVAMDDGNDDDNNTTDTRNDNDPDTISGSVVLCYMPALKQVTNMVQTGSLDVTSLEKGINVAIDCCVETHAALRETILKTASSSLAASSSTAPKS